MSFPNNARPVPYRGESGILWPIISKLLQYGFSKDRILILVATGTHRPLTENELRAMLDPKIFETGIPIINHECNNPAELVYLGKTVRGSQIYINRQLCPGGLEDPHWFSGKSFYGRGLRGRKSVCPGLIGEEGTYVFHSAAMLVSENACEPVLEVTLVMKKL